MGKTFLKAEWRNLIMANYAVDPGILKKYLPYRTELDDFNGTHFISLVGFLFKDTKVLGCSFPFHTTFEEVNLRFYVRSKEDGTWKRGVVFIREFVPRRIITLIANSVYNENYRTCQMKHSWQTNSELLKVAYHWEYGNEWNVLSVTAAKESHPIREGSEEEFITEHYWGYTRIGNETTGAYKVAHPKWNIHSIKEYDINCNAGLVYGQPFGEIVKSNPQSVLLADGSPIEVMEGYKLQPQPGVTVHF